MKPLYIGMGIATFAIIIGLLFNDLQLASTITGWLAIILLAVAMLLSGTFVSGDRMRANQVNETTASRHDRNKNALNALLISLPIFAVAIALYIFLP